MSKFVRYFLVIAWALLIWSLTTTPDFKVTEDSVLSLLISNGGHFIFFGIQAVLIYLALPVKLVGITLSSLYGLLIELVQRNIPGRSGDVFDWLLDTLGAITFLLVLKKLQSKS